MAGLGRSPLPVTGSDFVMGAGRLCAGVHCDVKPDRCNALSFDRRLIQMDQGLAKFSRDMEMFHVHRNLWKGLMKLGACYVREGEVGSLCKIYLPCALY